MATNSCLICGVWFEAKTERKKTCSDKCRKQLSLRGGKAIEHEQKDGTNQLLLAINEADSDEIERLRKAVFPLELDDIGLPPLELRRKYGPTADLSTVLRLRGLPPQAALLDFMEQS